MDSSSSRKSKLIADDVFEIIMEHKDELDSAIIYDRDFNYDYFGFKVHVVYTPLRVRSLALASIFTGE